MNRLINLNLNKIKEKLYFLNNKDFRNLIRLIIFCYKKINKPIEQGFYIYNYAFICPTNCTGATNTTYLWKVHSRFGRFYHDWILMLRPTQYNVWKINSISLRRGTKMNILSYIPLKFATLGLFVVFNKNFYFKQNDILTYILNVYNSFWG